jgi:uncharacterized membrane protein YoaK (UPF0700 family)
MTVQNAPVQMSLKGTPTTAAMTTNITRFIMDVDEVLLGRETVDVEKARSRANRTWPAILGFALGCAPGVVCEASLASRLWHCSRLQSG